MLRALRVACADTVPIALRMVMGKSFPQGPFKLGMPQPVINAGAIIYMIVSVVRLPPASCPSLVNQARRVKMPLPDVSPVSRQDTCTCGSNFIHCTHVETRSRRPLNPRGAEKPAGGF